MFKVNNRNTITTSSGLFIVNFEHISHFQGFFEQVNVDWEYSFVPNYISDRNSIPILFIMITHSDRIPNIPFLETCYA